MSSPQRQAGGSSAVNRSEEKPSPWANKEAEKILGATNELGDITFLVKFKGADDDVDLVPASQANILWPQIVIAFYELRVRFVTPLE